MMVYSRAGWFCGCRFSRYSGKEYLLLLFSLGDGVVSLMCTL